MNKEEFENLFIEKNQLLLNHLYHQNELQFSKFKHQMQSEMYIKYLDVKTIINEYKRKDDALSDCITRVNGYLESIRYIYELILHEKNAYLDFLIQCTKVTSVAEVVVPEPASAEPVASPSHAEPASFLDQHSHDECQ